VHCAPAPTPTPAPHAITLIHGAISSMGSLFFDSGTVADLGLDGNRILADSLGVKHAPVARHCHIGRVVDLFVQSV
jgi:hypothetical protein